MNGVANGLSALAPVIIGSLIDLGGSYLGGLMFVVGLCLVGVACMGALVAKGY
jgi:hypothetical protein